MKRKRIGLLTLLFMWLCVLPAAAENRPVFPTDTAVPSILQRRQRTVCLRRGHFR